MRVSQTCSIQRNVQLCELNSVVTGSVVDLTAIYTKFTNGSGNYATYQLTLNTDRDVVVK